MPLEDEKKEEVRKGSSNKISLKDIMGDIGDSGMTPPVNTKKTTTAAKKTTAKKTTAKKTSVVSVSLNEVQEAGKGGLFDGDLTTPPTDTTSEFEWTPQSNPFDIDTEQKEPEVNPFQNNRPVQEPVHKQPESFLQPPVIPQSQPSFTQPQSNPFELVRAQVAPSAGFVFQPLGSEVVSHELSRTKFAESRMYRGTIPFTDRMGVARYHYDKRVGTFFCFGGSCCKKYNTNVRVVLPWVSYETDKKGTVISKEVHCGFLQLTEDDYNEQIKPYALGGKISEFDYQVICVDEKYQKMVFNQLPGGTFWKMDPKVSKFVVDRFTELWSTVHQAIAKTLTEEELAEALTTNVGNSNNYPDYPQMDLNRFQKR